MSDVLAYTCPSKWGPYECGPVDYWISQGFAWLLFGLVVLGGLFWLYAVLVGRWRDRPAARRERALAELDRREAERERAARRAEQPPPLNWRNPQPW